MAAGPELLREVKENMPGYSVILLTANDTDLDIVDGLERGADDYITKPFSFRFCGQGEYPTAKASVKP